MKSSSPTWTLGLKITSVGSKRRCRAEPEIVAPAGSACYAGKIREAYAGRDQPAEYPPLPAWDNLSLELREALISIYNRGRRDGILDELTRAMKAGG
jgi:hypothetical protein